MTATPHQHTSESLTSPNGITRWMRVGVMAFVVQLVVIMSSLVWGYSKLESKVDEMNRRLDQHINTHSAYLARETWEVRNKFVDEKLTRIEQKLDFIIETGVKK